MRHQLCESRPVDNPAFPLATSRGATSRRKVARLPGCAICGAPRACAALAACFTPKVPTPSGRPTAAEKRERKRLVEARTRAARGLHHQVRWSVDGRTFGPHPLESLEEAVAKREEMIVREGTRPIPADYYEAQARVLTLAVWVEAWNGSAFIPVAGSERSGVWGVEFVDRGVVR